MNTAPDNAALIDRLAAEYVLGTLRGAARRRLERWRRTSALVESSCASWEGRLMPLLQGLKPVQPPPHVWQAIRGRLQLPGISRRVPARTLALAASVLLVVALALLWYWRAGVPGRVTEVATITAPSGTLMWQVEVYARDGSPGSISVHAGSLAAHPEGRDYELWALPKSGPPVSLGLLPYKAGTAQRALSTAQQAALASSAQLAVSLEPPGGSPTGKPTGAVVFVAPLHGVS